MTDKVEAWSVDQVAQFLKGLQLEHLTPAFIENAVDGRDLLELTDEELLGDLKCTSLQVKKIRAALQEVAPGAVVAPPTSTSAKLPASTFTSPPIIQDDLKKYASLTAQISDLEGRGAEAAAAAAAQRLQQATAQRAAAAADVKSAEVTRAEAQEKLEACGKWYPGKYILGEKKREAKADEREHAYDAAAERKAAAEKKASDAAALVATAQADASATQAEAETLRNARAQQLSLLQRVFNAPEWAEEPTLKALAYEAAVLEQRATEAAGHAATYARAGKLIKSADAKINGAMNALRRTRMMGAMEFGMDMASPFRRTGGSMLMDMGEMMMVQQANEAVKSAARDLAAARGVLPALPITKEGALQAAQAGVFVSMLAPGIGGNMMQQAMLQKSMATVREMAQQVTECAQWVKINMDIFSNESARFRGEAAGKWEGLVAHQRGLMDTGLHGKV